MAGRITVEVTPADLETVAFNHDARIEIGDPAYCDITMNGQRYRFQASKPERAA